MQSEGDETNRLTGQQREGGGDGIGHTARPGKISETGSCLIRMIEYYSVLSAVVDLQAAQGRSMCLERALVDVCLYMYVGLVPVWHGSTCRSSGTPSLDATRPSLSLSLSPPPFRSPQKRARVDPRAGRPLSVLLHRF